MAMPSTSAGNITRSTVVELHFENSGGQVTIVPPNNDIMAMSVGTAIEACRAFTTQIQFKDQFDALLNRLVNWLESHKSAVGEAYLTVRDSGLLFLVVTQSNNFEEALEDDLTELELEIANDKDFDLITLAVHAIPNAKGETKSFVSKKMAVRFVRQDG